MTLIGNAAALACSAVYGCIWRDGGGVGGTTGSSGTSTVSSALTSSRAASPMPSSAVK